MDKNERELLLTALDALGIALAEHGHIWTARERTLYERSVKMLRPSDSKRIANPDRITSY